MPLDRSLRDPDVERQERASDALGTPRLALRRDPPKELDGLLRDLGSEALPTSRGADSLARPEDLCPKAGMATASDDTPNAARR